MRKLQIKWWLVCLLAGMMVVPSFAQNKRPMTVQDVQNFQRMTYKAISNDGKWVISVMEPWRGDGDRNGNIPRFTGDSEAKIYNQKGTLVKSFKPIANINFSSSSKYAVLSTKQSLEEKEAEALKKQNEKPAKKGAKGNANAGNGGGRGPQRGGESKPLETLIIYALGQHAESIDSVRSYKLADKTDWLAYQTKEKDSTLYVRVLGGNNLEVPSVTSFQFSKEGKVMAIVAKGKGVNGKKGLFLLKQGAMSPVCIHETEDDVMSVTFSEDENNVAFLTTDDKDNSGHGVQLWLSQNGGTAKMIVDKTPSFAPKGWVTSPNGNLRFSKDASRLFFGTAPDAREKDTLVLASNRPEVQVWSWNEPVQYTVQDFNKTREARRTYTASYDLGTGKLLQLSDKSLPELNMMQDATSQWALVSTSEPYSVESMWRGRSRSDVYILSMKDGSKRELAKGTYTRYRISPTGKYAFAYAEVDSTYVTVDLATGKSYIISTPETFAAWDDTNDVPDYPRSYGIAGWTANDEALFIYDKYDIWKFSPTGDTAPVNMTKNGRSLKLTYRLIQLEDASSDRSIDLKKNQLLSAFNEKTKGYAVYQTKFNKPLEPKLLMGGDYMLSNPAKAKDANVVMFTKETYEYFPDIYVSDLSFKNPVQITHEVDQQKPYIWGTTELISWVTPKGVKCEGVIYKPANFDPSKKYPLIVSFYETNSETLYSYRQPQPHRSTPDYHLYNSQGYVVFNPDIHYTDGHPGESCYDCVMSGVDKVLEGGYIDEKRMGAAGHSWGGYQTAYLSTRTDRFAAIESGAPVVNMFSAYGGIRWGSGMARAFQYEHTQSRIGGSIWEVPELYKENSPLHNLDKVKTPILIMHNDTDGHVPWYQGIEFFVALKRLGKPSWLLNYTGEPHWPVKMANRVDFQTRVLQFFNHYLKGADAPKWMTEGVKAVDQPYELGY